MNKIRVGVVGATGYTGEELVRLLAHHPSVEVAYVSGKEARAARIQDIFPYLEGTLDLPCGAYSPDEAIEKTDLIFLSLPHTVSMRKAPAFMRAGKKVIDMSADYRLKDTTAYERFYKTPHADSENLPRAVYGLPEVNRDAVKAASLVANPGCYPTGSILALFPGLAKGLFEPRSVIIDAKSGATGAGRKAVGLGFSDINESLKAYKVFEHQHVPEINQELSNAGAGRISVTFVPHLIPMNRGLLTTAYVKLAKSVSQTELIEAYRAFYTGEKFVKVYADGKLPETKHVVRTNFCDIGLKVDSEKGIAVIVSAIDNLGKGAAWQAVQNMNIMCGFSETEGIWQ